MAYRGADVQLTQRGQLEVSTPFGGFQDARPIAYQEIEGEQIEVKADFVIQDDPAADRQAVGFQLGAYDSSRPLVIDPSLVVYAGYIGGDGIDGGTDVAVDSEGNAYVTGFTSSSHTSFPVAAGPDTTFNADQDVFVAKVNAAGTALIYAGYIGGSQAETGNGIAVDADGNAFVTGSTASTAASFPVVMGPDLTYNGGETDAFVAKVDATGTALLYAGYIGGSESDTANGIDVDAEGNAYVAGDTLSPADSFPTLTGPDLTYNGERDAFVSKVNPAGTALVYSGYIGGAGFEIGRAIALDSIGNAYVAGDTGSAEETFSPTAGPDLTFNGGGQDAFIAKVESSGAALEYAGYIGGAGLDYGRGVAVDSAGRAYITGDTNSGEDSFPVAIGPDLSFNGGGRDGFIASVTSDGTAFAYAGYIGGEGFDQANAVAVDSTGSAHIAGFTGSTEGTFPVGRGPDLTFNGMRDAFVARVDSAGASIIHASYVGGEDDDLGWGIALDADGSNYIAGETISAEDSFPVTAGPDLTFNGVRDAFVAKLDISVPTISSGGIVNAASFLSGPIAPGEIISIFGSRIGPDEGVGAQLDDSGRVAIELADTQVLIEGEPVPLFFVRTDQVNAQATYRLDGLTSADIQIIHEGEASNVVTVPVAPSAPAFFTLPDDRTQVIAILPDGSLNSTANPARPGDVLVFYATGEGQTDPPGEDGALAADPFPRPVLPVEVIIGDLPAEVLYFGAAPGFSGLVQANVEIPQGLAVAPLTEEGVPQSNAVPIVATVGEGQSQDGANIAVGDGSGVIGDNNPPKANGQSLMTQEDTALPIVLTGSDADGETLTFSIVNGPANGALTGLTQMPPTSAGVTYTPNGDYNGPDSFVFRADDGNAGSATAVVNITVNPVDDPPIANDDVFSTAQNQTATRNVLFNDSDPDGDPLTVVSVTQGATGSVTTDGTNATYVPDEDFVGMDSFTYTISDGTSTDTATVTVNVRPPGGPSANEAPVAASLSVMTNQDTDLVITLSGNDPDSDPLAFSITSPPANGTLGPITKTGSAVAMVTYTPNPNYDGPDSFGFRVDDGEETATATVSITVKPTTNLAIAKTLLSAEFKAGTQVTYQVTVTNNGPKDATGVVVTDTLPAGLTFVSAAGASGCAAAGQVVTCGAIALPMAAPNNVAVWTIIAMIDSAATGDATNIATVSSPSDPNSPKMAQDGPRMINVMADLSLDKAVTSADFKAGQQATYTITVTNNGPADATSVTVNDTIPAPLSLVSATPSQGTCAGDPAVTCNLGTITAGAGATVTIVVDIPASATGTITNTATVSSPDDAMTGNNSDTDMTPINVMADLRIEKTGSPEPAVAGGGNLTYTLTVTNDGPADATSVTVTDTLPAGVSGPTTLGCDNDPNGGATCMLGTIAANASKQYTITVTVDASASGTLTNTATVVANETDPNSGNNMVMEDTTVQSNVDLSIAKTDGLATVVAGTQLTYTITAANAGPSDAIGAMIADTIPIELVSLNLVSCMPTGVGAACDPGLTPGPLGSNNFNATVDLPVGGSLAYQISGTVDPSATGTLANTATVTPPGGVTDTFPGNDSATDNDTAITKEADLSIDKTGPATATAGGMLTYAVTVTNNGPSDASNVVVTDNLPVPSAGGSLTFKPAPDSSAECSKGAGVITCSLAGLPAGAGINTKVFTLAFDVSANAMGTIDNPASVAADEPDPVAGNNAAAAPQVTIAKEAELTITKSGNNDPVVAGSGAITYTVTVNNAGPSDATDVVVTDTLPAGVTLVSTAGDCSEVTGVPTCTLDTITASS